MPRNPFEQRAFSELIDGIPAVEGPWMKNHDPNKPKVIPLSQSKLENLFSHRQPGQAGLPLPLQVTIEAGNMTHEAAVATRAWGASLPVDSHGYQEAYAQNVFEVIPKLLPTAPLGVIKGLILALKPHAMPRRRGEQFEQEKRTIYQQITDAVIERRTTGPPFTAPNPLDWSFDPTEAELPLPQPDAFNRAWYEAQGPQLVHNSVQSLFDMHESEIAPIGAILRHAPKGAGGEVRVRLEGPGFVFNSRLDEVTALPNVNGNHYVGINDWKTGHTQPHDNDEARIAAWLTLQAGVAIDQQPVPENRVAFTAHYSSTAIPDHIHPTIKNTCLWNGGINQVDIVKDIFDFDPHSPSEAKQLHHDTMDLVTTIQKDVAKPDSRFAEILGITPDNTLQKLEKWLNGVLGGESDVS